MEESKKTLLELQDAVAEYAADWDEILEMVAVATDTPSWLAYLDNLVARLKLIDRKLNRVDRYVNRGVDVWRITNYTYDIYRYFTKKYGDQVIVTPMRLTIFTGALTKEDRAALQKRVSDLPKTSH